MKSKKKLSTGKFIFDTPFVIRLRYGVNTSKKKFLPIPGFEPMPLPTDYDATY